MQLDIVSHNFANEEVNAVSAKSLYLELELDPSNFSRWCKKEIVGNGFFVENQDWVRLVIHDETPTGGKLERTDYLLALDMAKRIAMKSNSSKSEEYRTYFLDCEKRLQNSNKLPTTYLEALEALVNSEKEKQLALEKVAKLNMVIDNEFGYSSILRAAKFVGVKETKFNWRVLKGTTLSLGFEVKRVPSPRYKYQNLYPIRAFQLAYPKYDFDDLKPESHEDKLELALI